MADSFYSHDKKYYKNQHHSYSNRKKSKCFVETHTIAGVGENLSGNIPLTITILPGAPQTIFEDFTDNHNKTLLQLTVPLKELPITVTIQSRRTNRPITATIPTGVTRIFQVEDFESLTASTASPNPGFFSVFIKKTFCICCNDRNDSCDEYYHEYDHNC
ncbi:MULTISPECIES: hypothetical protein [Bacillus]|uniref:hypothetical protein n=1 Tax=Bacillus TaxID=1386 RepID=UPI00047BD95F|nr:MULTISPECIES: hypothetical protein [Bacillus]WIY63090.1 exosporium protein D [Bacillus arachidis]